MEATSAVRIDGCYERDDVMPEVDEALLTRIGRGDSRAFERLYALYSAAVFSLALAIVRQRHIAEEVTQDVFLGIWRGAADFDRRRGSARSWLLALAHHKSVDAVRRQRLRAAEPISEEASNGSDVVTEALRRAEAAQARDALQSLPPDQRTAIGLAYYGGYTQQEIAQRLGVPLGTIKTRIRDGLIRLRTLLAPSERTL